MLKLDLFKNRNEGIPGSEVERDFDSTENEIEAGVSTETKDFEPKHEEVPEEKPLETTYVHHSEIGVKPEEDTHHENLVDDPDGAVSEEAKKKVINNLLGHGTKDPSEGLEEIFDYTEK